MALTDSEVRLSFKSGFENRGRAFDWGHLCIAFMSDDPECGIVVDLEVPVDADENRTKRQNIDDAKAAAREVLKAALAALDAA